MNREIKYRLHDKDGVIIGYETHEPNQFGCYQIYHTTLRSDWGVQGEKCLVREGYFIAATHKCQFTGLKDKNGVDVYEGDVILVQPKNANYPIRYVAVFNEDFAFRMRFIDRYVKGESGFYDEKLTAETYKVFEVIGNIHQNPELLNL